MRSIKALAALAWLVAPLAAMAGAKANPLAAADPAKRGRGWSDGYGEGYGDGFGEGYGGDGGAIGDLEGGPVPARLKKLDPPIVIESLPPNPNLPPAALSPPEVLGGRFGPARLWPPGRESLIAQTQGASATLTGPGAEDVAGAEGVPATELSGGRFGPARLWPPGRQSLIAQTQGASATLTGPGAEDVAGAEGVLATEVSGGRFGPARLRPPGRQSLITQSQEASYGLPKPGDEDVPDEDYRFVHSLKWRPGFVFGGG